MGMLLHRQRNRVGVTTTSTLIPDKVEPTEEVKVEEPEVEEVPVDETPEVEEPQKKFYTRTDIYRMTTAELKDLAKSEGLDDTLSGNKLKDVLIEHFGI
jgi:hypothetical protein